MTSVHEYDRPDISSNEVPISAARIVAFTMDVNDAIKNPEDDLIFFKDISFQKKDTSENVDYALKAGVHYLGFDANQPHLDVHFFQQNISGSSSLDDAKRSMGMASRWLKEVADRYPFVCGLTYKELAKAAERSFGFEAMLSQDDIEVSKYARDCIRIAHAVFKDSNERPSRQPFELACVVARTEQLAAAWSAYSTK